MQITIFEDESYKNFLPLVYLRPVYDLRCGVFTLREKLEKYFSPFQIHYHLRDELADIYRQDNPQKNINQLPKDDTWFVNGRVVANSVLKKHIVNSHKEEKVLINGKDIVAVFLKKESLKRFDQEIKKGTLSKNRFEGLRTEMLEVDTVSYPWDLVHKTSDEIIADSSFFKKKKKQIEGKVDSGVHLLNRKDIFIGKNSTIKPGAVLDAEKGPIIIGNNVTVMSNAVIEGPAFIGDNSVIKIGAKIYHGTSIGEWCKVGGEVEASVIQSYSNKQHEGFLGHSYLGSWVNLGADTNTSDLKNNYSTVRVQIDGKMVDSGQQFVGLTVGDHSKSGINMMFDTGTMVGVSCNLYGAGLLPKSIPSFAWGGENSFQVYDIEKSIETMRKVMARRNVIMSDYYEKLVREIFISTMKDRKNFGLK
ncbi:MAG: transferase [Chlorobiaceae bacterium]|nr:transferase [Chlorobiaceae bacterium]